MRKMMYKVIGVDGKEFETASFSKATANGCKIKETFFIPIDERTEKEKEAARAHARKIWEKKRG